MSKKLIGDMTHGYAMVDEVYANNIYAMEKIENAIRANSKSENGDLTMIENFDFKNAKVKFSRYDDTTGETDIYWDDGGEYIVAVAAISRKQFDKMRLEMIDDSTV